MLQTEQNKIGFFDYSFLFCTIIIAGRASEFARSFGSLTSLCTYIILFFSIVSFAKHKPQSASGYTRALAFAMGYITLLFIVNRFIAPGNYVNWFIYLTVAFSLYCCLKDKLMEAYENVIFILCIIAILLWIAYIIFPNVVLSIMYRFRFSESYSDTIETVNSLIFTIHPESNYNESYFSLPRNSGFAWEPGAFSCFINFAIYSNALRTNFRIKGNLKLIILLIALLTTQSTTGLLIFMLMLMVWLITSKGFKYLILVIPAVLFLWSQNFVGLKFMDEFNSVTTYANDDVGRLSSFLIYFEDFKQHPIFGGLGNKESYIFQSGYAEHLFSGLGQMLSYYGLVFTSIFIFCTLRNSKYHNELYNTKNGLLLLVVMIGTLISYNFWTQPLVICFWLSFLFGNFKTQDSSNIVYE